MMMGKEPGAGGKKKSKRGTKGTSKKSKVRGGEERRLERSHSSILPSNINNNFPFVALLLTAVHSILLPSPSRLPHPHSRSPR